MPGHALGHRRTPGDGLADKTLSEICTNQGSARNGGRSLDQLLEHMATDTLVGWAWLPGFGREPAPGTQKGFGALIDAWVKTGAVCPT